MKTGKDLEENVLLRDPAEVSSVPYGFIADQLTRAGFFRETDRNFLLKDLKLTLLLSKIFSDEWAFRNLVFKGGTCLVKYYLDYYRFSEDIDLTFIPRKNNSDARKKVDEAIFHAISELGWRAEKQSHTKHNYRTYLITASDGSTLKLSVSFNELFVFTPFKTRPIEVRGIEKLTPHPDLEKFKELLQHNRIQVYDEREILLEKYRCVLMRKTGEYNAGRDLLDLFELKQKGVKIPEKELIGAVVKKTLRSQKNGFGTATLKQVLAHPDESLEKLLQKALEEQRLLTRQLNPEELKQYATGDLLNIVKHIGEKKELRKFKE